MRSLRLLALCLVVAALALPSTASATPDPPQLRKDGRWLVDPYGRVVLVHGVNLVWKHAPYVPPDSPEGFTEADAEWLADHGFNGARLGTLWAGVQPTGPNSVDASYFTKWQRVIDDLAERGIWMQLDFHQDQFNEIYGGEGVPAWAVKRPFPFSLLPPVVTPFPTGYWTPEQAIVWDNFWAGKFGHLDAWANAWKAVAAHWKHQPYSMGYDLLNEPSAGTEWSLCLLTGCKDHYTRELQPAMNKGLAAVRQVDPDNIVWFAPQQLAGGLNSPTFFEPVPGEDQLGFSWHSYCTQVFLQSQGVPTDVEGCQQFAATAQTKALEEGAHMNAVGMMSEFGATDTVRALEIDTAAADTAFTSWMYWAYKVWNDPTTADTKQGMFFDDADLTTTKPKVATLVRTYPQATCGTPGAMSFDPGTGAFSYAYVAAQCQGQPTEIFVSPLHYPDGYDVQVTGGHVAGTADHHRVLVQASPGQTVTVTVRDSTP
ncbi:MAG TPA: cellulase family glycosylhydrolase [Nocardioidaceae bacterium]|nr:cellulase family glycosylhydrolase [Nocardioidaceae bacterium]